jgi:hypothetical protein
MSTNPEKTNFSPEHKHDAEALREVGNEQRERLEKLRDQGEKQHDSLETARHEVEKVNVEREKNKAELRERTISSPAERRNNGPIGRAERDASFSATMQEVQAHMTPASRTFSKIIHNKTVERISDTAASTLARPNAILSGAVFAFVLTLSVYLIAKNFGYPLSGFETIGAFILGWVIGLAYDFLKVMITGRK